PDKTNSKNTPPSERSQPTIATRKYESGHKYDDNISCIYELTDGLTILLKNAQAL
ncbi:4973_t:CDS:1, partial [Racocetra persica]